MVRGDGDGFRRSRPSDVYHCGNVRHKVGPVDSLQYGIQDLSARAAAALTGKEKGGETEMVALRRACPACRLIPA